MPADLTADGPHSPEAGGAGLTTLGYADAVIELEEILAQLDTDDVDVDHLAAQVRRAAELIALCRDHLSATRVEVDRIVADLDALAAPTEAGTGTHDDDTRDDPPGDADGTGVEGA